MSFPLTDIVMRTTFTIVLAISWSSTAVAQRPVSAGANAEAQQFDPALVEAGRKRFAQNCAFCHGRNATGGESGPDLTRSGVVLTDTNGNRIGVVVRNGLPGGMPHFTVSDGELRELVAFLHTRAMAANSAESERRKITLKDMLTGNVENGRRFFDAHCADCHAASGDLKGVAARYQPMQLETAMLYPPHPKSQVSVVTASGQKVTGQLILATEFTVSLCDADGWEHSWERAQLKSVQIDSRADAHLKLLPQYNDAQIHDLFAYLETLQ